MRSSRGCTRPPRFSGKHRRSNASVSSTIVECWASRKIRSRSVRASAELWPSPRVYPEQFGVVGGREENGHRRPPAAPADLARLGHVPRVAPVANRGAGHAEPAGDLAVVYALGDEGGGRLGGRGRG